MLQKDWSRPVTDSSFFLDEKLAWMEHNNIDHAVVLNLSQKWGILRIPAAPGPGIRGIE